MGERDDFKDFALWRLYYSRFARSPLCQFIDQSREPFDIPNNWDEFESFMSGASDRARAEGAKLWREYQVVMFRRELESEHCRLHPLGSLIEMRKMTRTDLRETLDWLFEEQEATGHSFYCNRGVIVAAQKQGEAFVARSGDQCVECVGLLIDSGHGPDIITTRPGYRRLGIGGAMLWHSMSIAKGPTIEARCVTLEGEQLCSAFGFVPTGEPGYGAGKAFALDVEKKFGEET